MHSLFHSPVPTPWLGIREGAGEEPGHILVSVVLRASLSPPLPCPRHSRASLQVLGTVGEPINPEAWLWYHRVVGGERCPIVDTFWQTETVSKGLRRLGLRDYVGRLTHIPGFLTSTGWPYANSTPWCHTFEAWFCCE